MGNRPLVNTNFLLRVDAVYDLPCRKVSGFESEIEYETIQSGGVNDYVFLRQKPASKPHTFQVERYIEEDFFDPLTVGKIFEMPIVLYVSRYHNSFEQPKSTFTFSGCMVLSKKYGEMDAERSGLLVETTTIAYQQVLLENKDGDNPMAEWKFDKTGNDYLGTGNRKAISNNGEVRKADMKKNAKKWPDTKSARTYSPPSKKAPGPSKALWQFDKTGKKFQGAGQRSAAYDKKEVRKKEMEKMSRKWPGVKSVKKMNKNENI